jgi:Polysaccharide lyase family 4, domain III/Polysaccharide lyase family 4, domain II
MTNPQLPTTNQGWVATNLHPLREKPTFPLPNLTPLLEKPHISQKTPQIPEQNPNIPPRTTPSPRAATLPQLPMTNYQFPAPSLTPPIPEPYSIQPFTSSQGSVADIITETRHPMQNPPILQLPYPRHLLPAALALAALSIPAHATITLTKTSNTNWAIGNGDLNVTFDPAGGKITSIKLASNNTNILNPANQMLYPEFAGTPFGSGTQVFAADQTANYIDFSTTTLSAGNATLANGTLTNPLTYSFHYVMFNNDPDILTYEVVNHSATDPATSVGQGQFLMRVNPALFTNTYQFNTSVNNLGAQTSAWPDPTTYASEGTVTGRDVQDATLDVSGTAANGQSISGDFGTNFRTKYDYSSYEQLHQAQLEYGPNFAVSTIMTSQDSMTGGPTKQNLQFTDTILMQEFLSGHYGDANYSYVPPQGVDSSRLFGPFVFRITGTNNESGAQLYSDDINSISHLNALMQTDTTLIANGYVPFTQRSAVNFSIATTASWSSNIDNNTVVLSDNATNFQNSHQGSQYWAQIAPNGTASLTNVVPGTYRVSIYRLGQWGETRYNNVTITGSTPINLSALQFIPENFSSAAPIFTIGTPNRSANEFLNGHNTTTGGDIRAFQGSYNYWAEEQTLGNPGKVVYYGTAVGIHAATNDPNKWIADQWQKFNPGMYDATNDSTDDYTNFAPGYVNSGGGPGAFTGSPWEVHFTTTAAQKAQGQFVVLSVALAAVEASLTVSLNGHAETWHVVNQSDPMVRSGDAGYFQWLAFQFPVADLNANGADDDFTFSVSTTDGVMYDALRMEITNTSAAPSTTGWFDYEYINGTTNIHAADATGLTTTETLTPEPASALLLTLATPLLLARRRR